MAELSCTGETDFATAKGAVPRSSVPAAPLP